MQIVTSPVTYHSKGFGGSSCLQTLSLLYLREGYVTPFSHRAGFSIALTIGSAVLQKESTALFTVRSAVFGLALIAPRHLVHHFLELRPEMLLAFW